MSNRTRTRQTSITFHSSSDSVPLPQQWQRLSCNFKPATPVKTTASHQPNTSADSLSDCGPSNCSAALSKVTSFNEEDDLLLHHPLRWSTHFHTSSDGSSNGGGAGGQMQSRIPSRHGSLGNLVNFDSAARVTEEGSPTDHPLNTTPPSRLSRRATITEMTLPSTAALATGGGSLTPTSRYLSTPSHTALSLARLRHAEVEGSVGRSHSPAQDQTSSFHAASRRGSHVSSAFLMTAVPEDGRRGSTLSQQQAAAISCGNANPASPLAGEGSSSNPVTLMVSASGGNGSLLSVLGSSSGANSEAGGGAASRAPFSSGVPARDPDAALADAVAGAREEGSVARRRSHVLSAAAPMTVMDSKGTSSFSLAPQPQPGTSLSPQATQPRRRLRSDPKREASPSPSIDFATVDDGDAARANHRSASLALAAENGNKSPAVGPKRVHFNLQDPLTEPGFLASSLRLGGTDESRNTASLSRSTTPMALNTSPLALDVSGGSPEASSARAGQSAVDLRSGANSCSSSLSPVLSNAAAASAAAATAATPSTTPTLSLRLNLRDGRIEALPTANVAGRSRSASVNGAALTDTFGGATYKPQMPLPKPALKPYSRYNGTTTLHPAGSSSDSTPINSSNKRGTFAQHMASASITRGVLSSLQRAVARCRQRRSPVARTSDGHVLTPSVVQQTPSRRSSEVIVKWSLLGMAAMLSFLLILFATVID